MSTSADTFHEEVLTRLDRLAEQARHGGFDAACDLIVEALDAGGIVQAFGSGHSEAFAMEIAGRAGGLIPTNRIALRDLVLHGDRDVAVLGGSDLERDASVAEELLGVSLVDPRDIFVIASNSGVNGSIVAMALAVKERGHRLIAVTSLEHTNAVSPKHPSGRRLSDVADVVIDNLAPYGDATVLLGGATIEGGTSGGTINGDTPAIPVGAVSSITAAYIAQLLTIGVTERLAAAGVTPPVYLSANIPGGDEHNHALEDRYRGRIRRLA